MSTITPTTPKSILPIYDLISKIPGGIMVIPLIFGSVVGTFFPGLLELGAFTTALFKSSALPLIALLIFSTGMQISLRSSGAVLAYTGVVLLCKTLIPMSLVILLGLFVGNDGVIGISLLAMLAVVSNSSGGIWLAFTGKYGDYRDQGAYIASAVNDGAFFVLLFLSASGFADIPLGLMMAAIIPLLAGMVIGNLDPKWANLMKPTSAIVIPFFAFSLGTGINLTVIVTGGASGILLGVVASLVTGLFVFIGYKALLRRGNQSGIGFAAGTTAANSIITPEIVAQADPTFAPFVQTATAQIAASVLISAIIAPLVAAWVLKRQGGMPKTKITRY
ncbi:2-keto-3-deoxygluconate permease [Actinobacillus porcinus]|uniref:2-keto-3-deoxygluconate permease n=1 Tax=Actinobacillus porcinus TaxID=51048 RepID=UPI0023564C0C|nr:2-keto-3-deoxygluconate permease [Actinobacillus porcinus]MCI5764828.1 2-keto-3-deoxygluconate permease [Actinobacillus porcinus]MDY5420913.1 2-keto-3-deoxygluconate permease [Actinobacillus porcinus]